MLTFRYDIDERQMGAPHRVTASRDGVDVGRIEWSRRSGLILHVEVSAQFRRQGIATALLAQARRVAASTRGVASPRLNRQRTNDGEAFVRSLGERVPRRAQ